MRSVYEHIIASIKSKHKLLAVLIDPDKIDINAVEAFINKVNASIATHVFVGGSKVEPSITQTLVIEIKKYTSIPIVLFPGDVTQITTEADAILFLALLSGRNPEYLIGKHVEAVPELMSTNLEVIPTAYLLIENGKMTSVEKVTNTKPLSRTDIKTAMHTALAGEYLGMKMTYLEAGSGASMPVPIGMIKEIKTALNGPLIVGGGISDKTQLQNAYDAGADMVVIGTALERDETFFNDLKR